MSFAIKIYEFFKTPMTTPTLYGWFHLLFVALSILAGVLLCVTHKKGNDARVRRAVFVTGVLVVVLELYKMFAMNFFIEGDRLVFDFQWYIFPFQFCSTPMYIALLTGLFRRGRVHRSLMAFLATYAIFAGVCILVYPGIVFTGTAGINIQTMICHGSMLSIGIYLYGSGYVKAENKTLLRALPVFASCAGIALALNEIIYYTVDLGNDSFNMFYFSRHFPGTLPLYSDLQKMVPYPVALVVYLAVFTLAAYLMLLAAKGIGALGRKDKTKKSEE